MASGYSVGGRIAVVCIALVLGAIKATMRDSSSHDGDDYSHSYSIPDDIAQRALAAHRPLAMDEGEQVEVGSSLAAGAIFDPVAYAKAHRPKKGKNGKKPVVTTPSSDDVVVDYDGEPGAVESLVTDGLAAFGVPELVIHDVPAVLDRPARSLLYATADAILAGTEVDPMGQLAVTGATLGGPAPSTTLSLASEGDRIAIVFPGSKAKVTDRVAALLQGWAPAEAGGSQDFDESPEVLKLEVKARDEIRAIAAKWKGGKVPRNEMMTVEAPFPTFEGNLLYLAVDVEKIDGVTITGVLAATPSQNLRDGLGVGSRIETSVDKVLDYQWTGADGTERGGAVDTLLDKLEGPVPAPGSGDTPQPLDSVPPTH